MATIQRNVKQGGTNEFHTEWELGFTDIRADEVDADLNTLINAWNTDIPNAVLGAGIPPAGAAGGDLEGVYPTPAVKAGAIDRAKTAPDLWLVPIPTVPDVGKVLQITAGPTLSWLSAPQGPAGPPGPQGPEGPQGADGLSSGPAGGDLSGNYPNPVVHRASNTFVVTTGGLSVLAGTSVFAADVGVAGDILAHKVTVSFDPVDPFDLATKQYVDAQAGGIPEAPLDSKTYGRNNAAWLEVPAGPAGPAGPQGEPGISAGRILYYAASDASDIATYKTLLTSPSAGAEQTIATPCTGTGDVLVAAFATDPGVIGAVDYPAGTAFRRIYAMVQAGTARLHLQVYKRDAAGVETLVRDEFSPNFTNQVPALQEWLTVAPSAGALLATDRIVNKIYAERVTGPTTVTVTTYYEGTTHTSHIQTTISTGAQGPPGVGVPVGGATGTVLTKVSATDYDTTWTAPSSGAPTGPAGGDLGSTYPNPTVVKAAAGFTVGVAGAGSAGATILVPGNDAGVRFGSAGGRGRVQGVQGLTALTVARNVGWDGAAFVRDDTAATAWAMTLLQGADRVVWDHWTAAGAQTSLMTLWNTGNLTIGAHPNAAFDVATKGYVDTKAPVIATTATAPVAPTSGQLWWRSDPDANLFIYYNDGDTSQWVAAVPTGGGISATFPINSNAALPTAGLHATNFTKIATFTGTLAGTSLVTVTLMVKIVDSGGSTAGTFKGELRIGGGATFAHMESTYVVTSYMQPCTAMILAASIVRAGATDIELWAAGAGVEPQWGSCSVVSLG